MQQSIYDQIVRNSIEVTGVNIVVFVRFDPATEIAETLAWAGRPLGLIQPGMDMVRRLVPGWEPSSVQHPARINPLTEAVYIEGQSVAGLLSEIAAGTIDPRIVPIAERLVGIRHGFLCPLKAGDEVLGSLGFFASQPLTERERRICEAFALQASLTLENSRLAERVQEQVRRLQEARQLLREAEERQRKEIAELLHSRVQTSLLLVWQKLGKARELVAGNPRAAEALLGEVQHDLDVIREKDVRQASYQLHPSILRVGLIPALRSLAQRFEPMLRISVKSDAMVGAWDDPLESQLPEGFRIAVYRIAEEAFVNVQRHAAATEVELLLGMEREGVVSLRIKDNGRGFEPAQITPGLGTIAISDRVDQLSGSWKVVSSPGQGTELLAELPVPRS